MFEPVTFLDGRVTLHKGDCLSILDALPENSVDSVVTDPPYHLTSIVKRFGGDNSAVAKGGVYARGASGFMGKRWDGGDIAFQPETWAKVLRVLKPGGYLLAFASTRGFGRMSVAIEDAGFNTHPLIAWIFGCMDTATECLTRRGWLAYTDLLPTDEVMQWDSETDSLSWVVPERIHEYDYDGSMVQIKNRHTHQVLTPNHRVYAKVRRHSRHQKPINYEVVEARDIHYRPSNWRIDLPMASMLYEGASAVDPTFAYLVGWWLTDAWPHKDANACCFSQSKPATLVKLRSALNGLGASEYIKQAKSDNHNDEHTFYLTGAMADRLRNEFPNRILGWQILGWSVESRRALYEGLMDGDGSRNKAGQIAEAFWSQKQERRDVFLALALSIGIRCYEDPLKGVVYVNAKTRTTQVQDRQRANLLPYKGKVWCLSVPTGAFVARRSGRPFITGNSGFPKATRIKAEGYDGFRYGGQSLKPAIEPIYMGQKPFEDGLNGTENILRYGTGAVNIDGCRVQTTAADARDVGRAINRNQRIDADGYGMNRVTGEIVSSVVKEEGRWPANIIHDGSDEVLAAFPEAPGQQREVNDTFAPKTGTAVYGDYGPRPTVTPRDAGGSAARFFYSSKADADDRVGSKHPTVKPLDLIQYLCRLITPPGGTVLDPFAGTGTTGEAAWREGLNAILIEREAEYQADIDRRMDLVTKPAKRAAVAKTKNNLQGTEGTPLFGGLL